ncbi:uncharacterized protein LOC112600449 [Melanaphis sacchari]|uniref:uncharacterized protein LOC112600449 n=1 Tax=Melanaphis sacchari TaxID=742174 RepID=UPI000DC13959|nr:uncharacterized protein LOC112600449 [Melanaphis sacchari]
MMFRKIKDTPLYQSVKDFREFDLNYRTNFEAILNILDLQNGRLKKDKFDNRELKKKSRTTYVEHLKLKKAILSTIREPTTLLSNDVSLSDVETDTMKGDTEENRDKPIKTKTIVQRSKSISASTIGEPTTLLSNDVSLSDFESHTMNRNIEVIQSIPRQSNEGDQTAKPYISSMKNLPPLLTTNNVSHAMVGTTMKNENMKYNMMRESLESQMTQYKLKQINTNDLTARQIMFLINYTPALLTTNDFSKSEFASNTIKESMRLIDELRELYNSTSKFIDEQSQLYTIDEIAKQVQLSTNGDSVALKKSLTQKKDIASNNFPKRNETKKYKPIKTTTTMQRSKPTSVSIEQAATILSTNVVSVPKVEANTMNGNTGDTNQNQLTLNNKNISKSEKTAMVIKHKSVGLKSNNSFHLLEKPKMKAQISRMERFRIFWHRFAKIPYKKKPKNFYSPIQTVDNILAELRKKWSR